MPVTLDDIRQERERRAAAPRGSPAPPPAGVGLQDVQAERVRREQVTAPVTTPAPATDPEISASPTEAAIAAMNDTFPMRLQAPDPGAIDIAASTTGELAGGALGALTGPAAPVAVPVLAAAGAGTGLAISRYLQGEPVTMQELTGEALMSVIPEAITQAGRGLLRASKAARRARFGDLAQQARQQAAEVFEPPEKIMVSALFDQVAESGVKVDANAIRQFTTTLGARSDDLLKEVARIDRSLKSGSEFQDLIGQIQTGRRGAYDIGRLQALHSEIRKRTQATNLPFEAKQLLNDFDEAIDQSIFNGLARGQRTAQAEPIRNTLRTARAGWARLRRTEELGTIVEKAITSDGSGAGVTISLGRIKDTIRKGIGKEGRSVQRTFEHEPGARQQFNDFLTRAAKEHDKINVSLADLPPHTLGQVAGKLGDWMATLYSSTAGQKAFEDLVISGNGKLTHSTLAVAANALRREVEEVEESRDEARTNAPLVP